MARFRWVYWGVIIAGNLQCLVIYVGILNPNVLHLPPLQGSLMASFNWWSAAACAMGLWLFLDFRKDWFGGAVMVMSAVYCMIFALLAQFGNALNHGAVVHLMLATSVAYQLCSAVLLVKKRVAKSK